MADQITSYPGSIPDRSQAQATFDTNADAWLSWFTDTVVGEINTLATSVEADAASAEAAALTAEAASSLENYQGQYSAGTTYSSGQSVIYNSDFYMSLVGSNTGNTPDSSPSYWAVIFVAGSQTFTSSGTFNKVPGARMYRVELWGAGGGGGNNTSTGNTGGGGGGAFAEKTFRSTALGSTVTVTIGAGGAGGANSSTVSGSAGGNSTFGSLLTANGGKGGVIGNQGGDAGDGGKHNYNDGLPYSSYACGAGSPNNTGGQSVMGGGGGGGSSTSAGSGGVSQNGGSGGAGNATASTPGTNGSAPAGGGGASTNDGGGGNGADGKCIVYWW